VENNNAGVKMNSIMKKGSFNINDDQGNSYEIIILDKRKFEELKSKHEITYSNEIHEKFGFESYETKDGKIIAVESGNYALYPNKDLLITVLKRYQTPRSEELLFNKNPYGQTFPEHTEDLIRKFLDKYQIDNTSDSESLLEKIDKVIIQNRNQDFFDRYYLTFIAIVGECIRKVKPSKWEMYLTKDKITWQPYLRLDNRALFFIQYIQDDFFDFSLNKPLTTAYNDILGILNAEIDVQKAK